MSRYIKKVLSHNPIIELDLAANQCEMVKAIRSKLILPFVDIQIKNFDLFDRKEGLNNFKKAFADIKEHKVAIEYERMGKTLLQPPNFTQEIFFHIDVGKDYNNDDFFHSYLNRSAWIQPVLADFLQQFTHHKAIVTKNISTMMIAVEQGHPKLVVFNDLQKRYVKVAILDKN